MSLKTRVSRGDFQKDIKHIASIENIPEEELCSLVSSGKVVIPHNPRHDIVPCGIGEGLRIKVNVNIGTSKDHLDVAEELKKAEVALKYGADSVMDLSTGGDLDSIRREILKNVNVPLGTVPIYQAGMERSLEDAVVNMTSDDIFNAIEKHAKDGVDFMTVHCGVTKSSVDRLKRSNRLTGVVSRGGSFLAAWILHNSEENPLYSEYDRLLDMAREYDFTLSLGDGMRPGCIHDASDPAQIEELMILGELVERTRDAGVQVMVEGPGHVPIDQIEANVRMEKSLCHNAPFYVLGPLVTDIAPGYDHIVGAIGGAIAAMAGADFLCYVTPSEHLALPTVEDVKEGTIASKIAAHAVDITRGKDRDLDDRLSRGRGNLDWDAMFDIALDKEKANRYRKKRSPTDQDVCSMCGDLCAIRLVNQYINKK